MEIRTLENTSLGEITATFNEAFANYFIPLQFSEEGMAAKIKCEGIQLRYSIGAFDKDRLVGFILHGYDLVGGVATVYNGGTGVIPAYRGRGLTRAMYRYAVPLLKEEGIRHHVLEVIDKNLAAINVYREIGFQPLRQLAAFRGSAVIADSPAVAIREITSLPSETAFFAITPTWQNSTAAINRDKGGHQLLGAFLNEELVGYAAFVPAAGRVRQFAVHADHRRKGVGTALFRCMLQNSSNGSLLVTNVEEPYRPVTAFLEKLKFHLLLRLYEMKLEVD